MKRIYLKHLLGWTLALALSLSVVFSASQSSDSSKASFVSKKYKYRVEYPSSWYFQGMSGNFDIESFPPSKKLRRSPVPSGWAAMGVLVPEALMRKNDKIPESLSEWVALETRYQTIVGQRPLKLTTGYPFQNAIEVTGRCCVHAPYLVTTAWFFRIDGRFFGVYMEHYEAEPKAEYFRRVFTDLCRSVRALK